MKTRKILATLIAFVLMASVVAFPTKTFADEKEPFYVHVDYDYVGEQALVIINTGDEYGTAFEKDGTFSAKINGKEVSGEWLHEGYNVADPNKPITKGGSTGTAFKLTETYEDGDMVYYSAVGLANVKDVSVEIKYTAPGGATATVTDKVTWYSMEEMQKMLTPSLTNVESIRARIMTDAYKESTIEVKPLKFPAELEDSEAGWEYYLIWQEMMKGRGHSQKPLLAFLDITMEPGPDLTRGPVDISIAMPGVKTGTAVEVWHLNSMEQLVVEQAEAVEGAIVMRGLTGLSPFLIYADVTADVPETGDSSNMMPYGIMGAIAIAGVGFIALRKRVNS